MMFQLREIMVSGAASGFEGKRDLEMDQAYTTMDSEESLRKRKRQKDSEDLRDYHHQQELLSSNDQLVKPSKSQIPITSFFNPERRLTYEEHSKRSIAKADYYNNPMSLDLELNLSSSLIDLNHHHCHYYHTNNHNSNNLNDNDNDLLHDHQKKKKKKKNTEKGSEPGPTRRTLPWLGLDHDIVDEEEEMVARVCMKCHFLVMLCKASPSCPNCKFMHSPQQTSQSNFLFFSPKPPLLSLINYLAN